jgi:hypothetical protein
LAKPAPARPKLENDAPGKLAKSPATHKADK